MNLSDVQFAGLDYKVGTAPAKNGTFTIKGPHKLITDDLQAVLADEEDVGCNRNPSNGFEVGVD